MKEATVGYLLRGGGDDQEVLLGKRASLFRNGIWDGPGGKLYKSEPSKACLRREVREEFGVSISGRTATHFASVDFYHPYNGEFRLEWRVHWFRVFHWEGEPQLVNGFSELCWFKLRALPFDKMNSDSRIWIPACLNEWRFADRILNADIYYGDTDMTVVVKAAISFTDRQVRGATRNTVAA